MPRREEHPTADPQVTEASGLPLPMHRVAMHTEHVGHLVAGQQDRHPVPRLAYFIRRCALTAVPTSL